ncbi:Protein NRT1/ PTR FAMILY 5.10 [Hibiscus syriacus]|uniref:Protein NRT1/ PTR FAMILY 5.10 n=1 Tax=Hibiscus syriacus TaxID=106335 RepID=A0A6A3ADQ4_HIBSY|nr:Protein NRT1/ PTR FAMILY 5.10 [Hibiscus syriacus]
MAMSNSNLASAETPLLNDAVNGCVDFKGRPVRRSISGCWRSASFNIAVEVAESFAYFGIASNLISYLTGPLGQSTAASAAQVNAWTEASLLLPLLGAFVADSFLGRYRTIILAFLVYILGLGLLTLLATLPSVTLNTSSVHQFRVILVFSLYLIAIAQGGYKPCLQAFGADQFDAQDPEECKAKSSFFNWLLFGMSAGILMTLLVLNYIQENLSWVLGFAIPGIVMAFGLLVFLLGTTYRFSVKGDEVSPMEQGEACSIREVEAAKAVLKLVPIWATSLIHAVVLAQSSTLFTRQGATMDRSITTGLEIPAATLQYFISISVLLLIPIYDRIFVPLARSITGKPAGITMLQTIGTGIALSAIAMVIAALVEMKRLKTAREHGLVDKPEVTVPMSVWWLMPKEIKSIGVAIFLSVIGVGNLISSFLVSVIEKVSGGDGGDSWFADNMYKAHLDYLLLLAACCIYYPRIGSIHIFYKILYLYQGQGS